MAGSFSFADLNCVAFDLDHTAARYHVDRLQELVFSCMTRYLVEHKQYPTDTMELKFPKEFSFKGMVVDRAAGNLLKVLEDKRVVRAYHGTRKQLTKEEIHETYPGALLPHPYTGVTTEFYIAMNTYFDMPAAPLFGLLVDRLDAAHEQQSTAPATPKAAEYASIANDLLTSLYFNFAVYEQGYFFPAFRKDVGSYVFKRPKVAKWFGQLRADNVKVLLVTNSLPPFTRLLCEHAFGDDWENLFDLVIFQARKPQFWLPGPREGGLPAFNEVRFLTPKEQEESRADAANWRETGLESTLFPFKRVAMGVKRLETGHLYENGHVGVLTEFLERLCGKPAAELKLCYVGDHLISDVAVCKATVGWKTIAIVEELEHVEEGLYSVQEDGSHLALPHSKVWGSFFHDKIGDEKVDTAAMRILKDHANLCCSCLSAFTEHSTSHVYPCAPEHPLGTCALLQHEIPSYTLYYFTNPLKDSE